MVVVIAASPFSSYRDPKSGKPYKPIGRLILLRMDFLQAFHHQPIRLQPRTKAANSTPISITAPGRLGQCFLVGPGSSSG